MQMKFYLKNLRMSPRKVRTVADVIKGKSMVVAQNQLKFQARRPAKPLLKLLQSSVASAQRNYGFAPEFLKVENILVDEGPSLKRFRPRAFGRSAAIKKRTSHVTLVLSSAAQPKITKVKKESLEPVAEKFEKAVEFKSEAPEKEKPAVLVPKEVKPKTKESFVRKVFRRKAIG